MGENDEGARVFRCVPPRGKHLLTPHDVVAAIDYGRVAEIQSTSRRMAMTYPVADEEQEREIALRAAAHARWVELREQRKPHRSERHDWIAERAAGMEAERTQTSGSNLR
jgi:hypothetical protein